MSLGRGGVERGGGYHQQQVALVNVGGREGEGVLLP